jgi:hypothetical protein
LEHFNEVINKQMKRPGVNSWHGYKHISELLFSKGTFLGKVKYDKTLQDFVRV